MVAKPSTRGFHDWILQRLSALIIGLYAIFLFTYFVRHPFLHYAEWHALFSQSIVRIATVLTALSVLAHAWIGLWTVFTDYVKIISVRIILEILVIALLLACFIWCLFILYG